MALASRKLVIQWVELVNQSKEKDCEDTCVEPMMRIGSNDGVCGSPAILSILQASVRRSVLGRVGLIHGLCREYLKCLV